MEKKLKQVVGKVEQFTNKGFERIVFLSSVSLMIGGLKETRIEDALEMLTELVKDYKREIKEQRKELIEESKNK